MKIIITENQLKKHQDKLKSLIDVHGFNETSKLTGLSKLKLAKILSLPIKAHSSNEKDLKVEDLLKELVISNETYKNCDLSYSSWSGTLEWICDFKNKDKIDVTFTMATPYYDGRFNTAIESEYVKVYQDGESEEFDIHGDYYSSFENPSSFKNVEELVNWFETEYKPQVYDMVINQYKRIKNFID